MVRHIVAWKLLDSTQLHGDKSEASINAKALLEGLKTKVPSLERAEVWRDADPDTVFFMKMLDEEQQCMLKSVINEDTGLFDLCLYSEFANWNGLEAYVDHPDHKFVAKFIGEIRADRGCVDYEV